MRPSVGVVAFEQTQTSLDIASRVRAFWLVKHWQNAELFTIGRKYSAVLFQGVYWLDYASRYDGIKLLDICKPDFLDWRSQCIEMANACDGVIASTESLAKDLAKYIDRPVAVIPDRIDLGLTSGYVKDHRGRGSALIAAWYGYSVGLPSLDDILPDLLDTGIEKLIVLSDSVDGYRSPRALRAPIEITNRELSVHTLAQHLSEADVVLNYPPTRPQRQYTSNIKTAFAWALGLPVAHSRRELESWIPESNRLSEARRRSIEASEQYNIRTSVSEYMRIIESLGISFRTGGGMTQGVCAQD